jgi:hypothetical protein
MPIVAFSIRLDRIEESLLYKAQDGSYWLSCVCTFEEDAKGRTIVAQSIPRERYAAGERGPAIGIWREIGQAKPLASGGKGFDLARYKAAAQMRPPEEGAYPQGEESLSPAQEAQQGTQTGKQASWIQ